MVAEIRVQGAEDLVAAAARLKEAGRNDLRKEMLRGFREGAKPIIPLVRASLREGLPHRGGLAELLAKSKMAVKIRASGRQAGVSIVVTDPHDIYNINRGYVRHPVFGNRNVWETTIVPDGLFTKPMEENADQVRQAVADAIDDITRRLEQGH